MSRARYAHIFVAAMAVIAATFGCDLIDPKFNNPVDPGAVNHQGFETVGEVNQVKAVEPVEGGKLVWQNDFLVDKVHEGDSYHLQVSSKSGSWATADLVVDIGDSKTNQIAASTLNIVEGATYFWQARAHKAGVWGSYTAPRSFIAATDLVIVDPLDKVATVDTTPTLSWNDQNIESYELRMASTVDGLASATVTTVRTPMFTVADADKLAFETTLYWQVRGVAAGGFKECWNKPISFSLSWLLAAPLSPGNEGYTSLSKSYLSWDAVKGAKSYELQYLTYTAAPSTTVLTSDIAALTAIPVAVPSYELPAAIANNTLVYWRIRPVNDDGEKPAWGSIWSFTVTMERPELQAPIDKLSTEDLTPDFTWKPITGAKSYHFQLSVDSTFAVLLLDETTTLPSFTPPIEKALPSGKDYYWRVAQTDSSDLQSGFCLPWKLTMDWKAGFTMTAPLDKGGTKDGSPKLDWSDAPGVLKYSIALAETEAALESAIPVIVEKSEYIVVPAVANNGTRFWHVRSLDANSSPGSWGPTWSFSVGVPKVTLVSPVDAFEFKDGVPTFEWSSVDGASIYRIQIAQDKLFTTVVMTDSRLASTKFTPKFALANNTTYYWRVSEKTVDGTWSSYCDPLSFKVAWAATITLSAPANKAALTVAPLLEWGQVASAASYEVQMADTEAGLATASTSKTTTASLQLTFVNAGSTYWRVRPLTSNGLAGLWSSAWYFTASYSATLSLTAPADASSSSSSKPLLDWGTLADAKSYQIQIATSSTVLATATPITVVAPTTAYQTAVSFADASTAYWRVRAVNANGVTSAWGATWSVKIAIPMPALSSPGNAATGQIAQPVLSWTAITGAQSYSLQLSTKSDFSEIITAKAGITTTSYTPVTALNAGTVYYWRVAQKDVDGVIGSYSTAYSFTVAWTQTLTVVDPKDAASVKTTTPTLSWSAVVGASSYEIQMADTSAGITTATAVPVATNSYVIPATSSVPNGSIRYWRVRPINVDKAEGNWGTTWSFTVSISVGITVSPSMDSFPTVAIYGVPSVLASGKSITAAASVTPPTSGSTWTTWDSATYAWYLDGKAISGATSANYVLSSAALGLHSLSVTTTKGTIVGTASTQFRTVDEPGDNRTGLNAEFLFSGSPADSSGNALGVTLSSAPPVLGKDRFGAANSAYAFSASTQSITVSQSAKLTPANFTWSVWIKPTVDPTTTTKSIMAMGTVGSTRLDLHIYNNYRIQFGMLTSSWYADNAFFAKDVWTNIAVSYDGTTLRFYQDGVFKTQVATTVAVPTAMTSGLVFGNDSSSQAFTGAIDDARIHNRALTDGEVLGLFKEGGYGSPVSGAFQRTGIATGTSSLSSDHVLDVGASTAWDKTNIQGSSVIYDSQFKMWYSGSDGANWRIGYATSPDGVSWTKYAGTKTTTTTATTTTPSTTTTATVGYIFDIPATSATSTYFDKNHVMYPSVILDAATYKMWYTGYDGSKYRIGYATSTDGITWTRGNSGNAVLDASTTVGAFDAGGVEACSVIKSGSTYVMYYTGINGASTKIGRATSSDGITWTKATSAVLANQSSSTTAFDKTNVAFPSVMLDGSTYRMWYAGYNGSINQIGYAESTDGLTWTRGASPVLPVGPSGFFDASQTQEPCVIYSNNQYWMWYSGKDSTTYRFGLARLQP